MRPLFQNERQRKRVRETYPLARLHLNSCDCGFLCGFSVVLGVVPFRQHTSAAMFNGSSSETEPEREEKRETDRIRYTLLAKNNLFPQKVIDSMQLKHNSYATYQKKKSPLTHQITNN